MKDGHEEKVDQDHVPWSRLFDDLAPWGVRPDIKYFKMAKGDPQLRQSKTASERKRQYVMVFNQSKDKNCFENWREPANLDLEKVNPNLLRAVLMLLAFREPVDEAAFLAYLGYENELSSKEVDSLRAKLNLEIKRSKQRKIELKVVTEVNIADLPTDRGLTSPQRTDDGSTSPPIPGPQPPDRPKLLRKLLPLCLLLVGLVFLLFLKTQHPPHPTPPAVEITSPKPGATVGPDPHVPVSGTVHGVDIREVWVIIQSGGTYYVQDPVNADLNGSWHDGCTFGEPEDKGPFSVTAMLNPRWKGKPLKPAQQLPNLPDADYSSSTIQVIRQ